MNDKLNDKDLLPIVGSERELFGKIVKDSDSSFSKKSCFLVYDIEGNEVSRDASETVAIAVYPKFYSYTLHRDTAQIIIVKPDNEIIKAIDCDDQESDVTTCLPISDNLLICIPRFVHPQGYMERSFVFHPMEYVDWGNSQYCVTMQGIVKKNERSLSYLFSMQGLHFFVDYSRYESDMWNVDWMKCVYYLLNDSGSIVKAWGKDDELKVIWCKMDGGFSIISHREENDNVDEYGEACESSDSRTIYDEDLDTNLCAPEHEKEKNYISVFHIPGDYESIGGDCEKDSTSENCLRFLQTHFGNTYNSEIEIRHIIENLNPVCKSDYSYRISSCYYNRVKCDDYYLVVFTPLGFAVFSPQKLIVQKELLSPELYDEWKPEDGYKHELGSWCSYANKLIGFYICYQDYEYEYRTDPEGEEYIKSSWLAKKREGNYKICDIYGNILGELDEKTGVFNTLGNDVDFPRNYGVVSNNFQLIIPPIFSKIEPLAKNNNKETIYVVTQTLTKEKDGCVYKGVYMNEKILIPLGDNDIQKITGHYFIVKHNTHTDNLSTLYYHSGEVLCDNVMKVEAFHYYDLYVTSDWRGGDKHLDYHITCLKVYVEDGFLIVVDGKILTNRPVKDCKEIVVNKQDIIFAAYHNDTSIELLSSKRGLLLNDTDGNMIVDVKILKHERKGHCYKIIQLIKRGALLDETANKILNKILHRNYPTKMKCVKALSDGLYYLKSCVMLESGDEQGILKVKNALSLLREKSDQELQGEENLQEPEYDYFYDLEDIRLLDDYDASKDFALLCLELSNGTSGVYHTGKGWIVGPIKCSSIRLFSDCFVFNDEYVIKYSGEIRYNQEKMDFICSLGDDLSAFYVPNLEKYIIIDDGWVKENLINKGENIWVDYELENVDCQIRLDVSNRILERIYNEKRKENKSLQREWGGGHEWTMEDSWDAMTDGQYGDYPGDWDNDMFGL